jgi:hypothetical protein
MEQFIPECSPIAHETEQFILVRCSLARIRLRLFYRKRNNNQVSVVDAAAIAVKGDSPKPDNRSCWTLINLVSRI